MKKLFVLVLTCLVFACVPTSQNLKSTTQVGTVYEKEIVIGAKKIPLSEGKWTVIASGLEGDFFKVYLLKEYPGKKFSYIHITTDSLQLNRPRGYVASSHFDRTNMYFKEVNSNIKGQGQDAWSVNYMIVHFNQKAKKPVLSEAANYIRNNGYVISDVMLVAKHRVTGTHVKSRYLQVRYAYNPDVEGIPPVPKSDWKSSDWHKMRINKDPQKEAFVEKVKIESAAMHKRILQGLGDHY